MLVAPSLCISSLLYKRERDGEGEGERERSLDRQLVLKNDDDDGGRGEAGFISSQLTKRH